MGASRRFSIPSETPEDEEEEREELDEEEEEGEEEEEEQETAPDPVPEVVEGKTRLRNPPRQQRRRKTAPRTPVRDPEKSDWPRDVEQLWTTILSWLPSKGRRPEDVSIQVIHMGGVAMAATMTVLEPKIRGDQVLGDQSLPPGDALKNMIIDVFHAKFGSRGRYKVKFIFPISSTANHGWEHIKESEEFTLDDIGTINLRRQMAYGWRPQGMGASASAYPMGSPGGGYPPPYGSPYGQQPPPYPYSPPYPPPQGFGAVPQPNPAQDFYARQVAEMHGTMMGLINELRQENAEIRGQPPPAPVQIPMPAPPPVSPPPVTPSPVEQKIDRLLDAIGGLVSRPVATGLGAAGAPASATDPIEAELKGLTVGLMRGVVKKVVSEVSSAITGIGSAPDEDGPSAGEVPAPTKAPTDPKEELPFQEVKLEATWSNGSPVIYTPSKDGTGLAGVSPMGFVTSNPFVVEKATEIVGGAINKLGEAFADAVSRMTSQGAAHMVSRVPPNAMNAGVAGAPQQQQPAQQAPPPPSPAPAGGWPTPQS